MAIKILMPALSPTMTEGTITKWLKKEGDKIKPGEVIAEIETDKAIMEVESADGGILGKIIVPDKTVGVKVNALIGVLIEAGEDKSAIDALIESHKTSEAQPSVTTEPPAKAISTPSTPNIQQEKSFASPLAKRVASNMGVDISRVAGSGPRGRVVREDIINFKRPHVEHVGRHAEDSRLLPLTQMQKTIATRLQTAKSTIPHFYLTIDCDVTELEKTRNYLNAKARIVGNKPEYKLSVNDFVVKAIAVALKKVPEANASWSDDGIIQYNNVDISVAVAIQDGLITPIIRNADQKSFQQISDEVKDLAARAKNHQLRPEEFMGGSFTVSNLGMYGVKEFQAIINPPQACILAVSTAYARPVVKNGVVQPSTIMTVSISCDHRVVDGVLAAVLMQEFKAHIEQPVTMFV